MLANIPATTKGRAILSGLRQYLNHSSYLVRIHYSGPRAKRAYNTPRPRMRTSIRVYVDRKKTPRQFTMDNSVYALQGRCDILAREGARMTHEVTSTRAEIAHLVARNLQTEAERARLVAGNRTLQIELQTAQDDYEVAVGHAIDCDVTLEAIPLWLQRLCVWFRDLWMRSA